MQVKPSFFYGVLTSFGSLVLNGFKSAYWQLDAG